MAMVGQRPRHHSDRMENECNGADHRTDRDQTPSMQTKRFAKRRKMLWNYCAFVILVLLPSLVSGQFWTTRDPRYYNREGDFHYKWPNPGDPDYR